MTAPGVTGPTTTGPTAQAPGPGPRGRLLGVAARVKDTVDTALLRGKRATGLLRPLRARPYLGHGSADLVHVKGRVRERTGVKPPRPTDTWLTNVLANVRRFTATPVPDAQVLLRIGDAEQLVRSDSDGYFRAGLRPASPLTAGWHDLTATLLRPVGEAGAMAGAVLVPPADAAFAVISDLDDTVLRSHITSPARAFVTALTGSAATRTPFRGVAAFYRALQAGSTGTQDNPLFYVSSSPWNLYDLVLAFLDLHKIPAGPLFLRAWGLDEDALPGGGHHGHKLELILGLLDTYPQLRFVLIGDSGQQDPEIYRDVALALPDRILAVYVRDVTTDQQRDAAVHVIAATVRAAGVPFELVRDTAAAARHAAGLDLLTDVAAAEVAVAVG